ncbi:MAG: hypothetical protein H7X95_08870 [Deltaproteobacteria bacterium]|nr:hypothetical protein [Deltaproteobacteria bacterium]
MRQQATGRLILGFALVGVTALAFERPAHADTNDLRLINLCPAPGASACPWITQSPTATVVNLDVDPDATSRFRSLMSEMGVVIAPRLQTPADTLGFAGFQFSLELGMTQISRDQSFWNGVDGVSPSNPTANRPNSWLNTMGVFVRKGMWFPVPALEWGVGAVNVMQSGMWALQGYVKLALHEGFHQSPFPSVAIRGGFSQLVGTDQVTLTVSSVDVLASKAFSLAGTARVEPFLGWNFLFIDARSGVIDGTPACDAYALHQTQPSNPRAGTLTSCPASQLGTWADLGANFTFPKQDIITRHRVYGGAKVKLAMLFLVAQVAVAPAGSSSSGAGPGSNTVARDKSATQRSATVSAGFDF